MDESNNKTFLHDDKEARKESPSDKGTKTITGNDSKTPDEDDEIISTKCKSAPRFQRYDTALKNLIPIRKKAKDDGSMLVDSAGLFSIVTFSWVSNIMYKAAKTGLKIEELPRISPYDAGLHNAKRLERLWEKELARRGPEKASFSRVVWQFCRTRVLASFFILTCSLFFGFLSYTYLMQKLLEHVQSGNGSYTEGVKWAALLIIGEVSRTLFLAWTWALNYRSALRLRAACAIILYRKIIRVDNLASKNIGKVINMFSNDAHRIFDLLVIGPMIIAAPISTAFGIFYILTMFGPIGLLGMIAFILFFPIQYLMSRLGGYLQNKSVKVSDMRVRLMNEILDCIKLIKMYAWEERFGEDLLRLRDRERKVIAQTAYCRASSECMAPAVPIFSSTITFVSYIALGNNLTAAQVFPYTTLLDSGLRVSLYFFQDSIYSIVAAGVAFRRLKNILILDDGNCLISKPISKLQALTITNGTFAYNVTGNNEKGSPEADKDKNESTIKDNRRNSEDKHEETKLNELDTNSNYVDVLFDISFEAAKGKLVGICGTVGSGKSSLLLAVLGQLRVSEGQVTRDGDCAYVSQQAWITNATLRENILFGAEFDEIRYNKVVHVCSLIQDIAMMPGGDQTEIGEKGVNLSGGQKQRVALARALYADRDIYLLDDPLSAVDSRVGAHIFSNLILGALKGKTVLFVTHQIQYLNRCDDVYMMRDGRIIEHGTHDDLMKLGNEYASMVAALAANDASKDEIIQEQGMETLVKSIDDIPIHIEGGNRTMSVTSRTSKKSLNEANIADAQLIVAEDIQEGSIKLHTYRAYVKSAGGYFISFMASSTYLVFSATNVFSSSWLAYWLRAGGGNVTRNNETIISDDIRDNPDFNYYQTIYLSAIIMIILAAALRTYTFIEAALGASTNMHRDLFKKIMVCPMRFFDTNPIGRIQHLFSRDMDEVDNRLPYTIGSILDCGTVIFISLLIISAVFPWFIIPLVVLGALYYYISKIFRVAIRDLKRMDNKARAPIISYVTATVEGLSTIHAFGKESDFLKKFSYLFDENSKCLFLYNSAMRWLAIRIDILSVAVTGITAFLVIGLQSQVPASFAGLALAYSTQISDTLQYTVRALSEAEVRFISVERINHYIRTLVGEGNTKPSILKSESTWPARAQIKFNNVSLAYGDGSPPILKSLSFTINAGEKIGIVGRTGAGKSSLTVALFRLVELVDGKIEIDDVDISQISLRQLRTKLSIIPQDPVLFSGTVRSNLDPFKLYSDAEIWDALEKTELKNRVQSISGQLDATVGFGGDNMSVGERQLLCLSRALLRNSKILVLDEATAAVDPETERAVQNTVQKEFSHCTILIIAHRLQTVVSLNRVLVMDAGKVLEFDTPSNLLADPNSEFSKMIAAAEEAESK